MSDPSSDRTMMSDAPLAAASELFAGRYRLGRLLGRGGMGAVYEARDEAIGETVALKLLETPDPAALDRFRREVKLARRITHPNVARTHDLGVHGDVHYLTMEFVPGTSLRDAMSTTWRPAPAATVALAIAQGLSAAHEAGVVHRDLKPENVLIDPGGRVVLTDFGIAHAAATHGTRATVGTLGTPAYMAPEQVEGAAVDARTDLYALGLLLAELLTGSLPFERDTAIATAVARLHEEPPDLRARAELPPELAQLVMDCLARDPRDRPASASEVASRLAAHATGDAVAIPRVTPAAGTRPTRTTSAPATRSLAVLPMRYRGPAQEAYLAEALHEEIIDLLSRTRGLKVCGRGATAQLPPDSDPRALGSQLGVDTVVDGTVSRAGPAIRITARLLDVRDGFQLWSDRFEGRLEDVFELQDRLAKRIAEALRLEVEAITHRTQASPEAVESYLRARQQMNTVRFTAPHTTVELFEQTLELAPDFAPALAGLASATLRAWFAMGDRSEGRDWMARAEAAVARALAEAPHLAESQLVAGMLAVQHGHLREAAHALTRALELAPTYADAHDYLGRLQCEAGRADEGMRHIELALELDPTLGLCLVDLARCHALAGDLEGYERALTRLKAREAPTSPPVLGTEMRVAAWLGDLERVRACRDRVPEAGGPARGLLALVADAILGDADAEETADTIEALAARANPRFAAMALQLGTEMLAKRSRPERALSLLTRAAEGVLVDVNWMDHCPALAPLRSSPGFASARRLVSARADAIWSTERA